jgi:hypothetical protein
MVFFADSRVAAVLMFRKNGMPQLQGCKRAASQSRTTCTLLRSAPLRLALDKKSSPGAVL